jgi:putative transcriptional regulator
MAHLVFLLGLVWCTWPTASRSTEGAPLDAIPANSPAKGVFLVADKSMPDPRFRESVILLLEHDNEGTLGVIVNRATELQLAEAVPDLAETSYREHPLFFGGPVGLTSMLFLIRSNAEPEQSVHVLADIYHSSSRAALDQVLQGKQPVTDLRFFVGYSGWGPGQLDAELSRHDWRLFRADPDLVFRGNMKSLWRGFMAEEGRLLVRQDTPHPVAM